MKVQYDSETDTLNIVLSEGKIVETDEEKSGVNIDYDKDGNIVEIEVLSASKRVAHPNQMF